VNKYGEYETGRIFYRARKANNIIGWINKGIHRNKKTRKKYALEFVREESENPEDVQKWIDKNIFNIKNTNRVFENKNVEKLGNLIRNIL